MDSSHSIRGVLGAIPSVWQTNAIPRRGGKGEGNPQLRTRHTRVTALCCDQLLLTWTNLPTTSLGYALATFFCC